MDQKHAMLYPELQPNANLSRDQRALASTSIGLPSDVRNEPPPPSYDIAISSGTPISTERNDNENWFPNSTTNPPQQQQQNQQFGRNEPATRSFIGQQQPQNQQSMPAVNIITQQHSPKLGPHPCTVFCPSCGTARATRMAYMPNTRTHLCALVLCLVGWCCCACLVPYCMNSCRTGNHYCVACNTFLGIHDPRDIP